jgi:hypothetical protein
MAILGASLRMLGLLAVLLAAVPALAQPAASLPAADRQAIRGVIESQMSAFRADDGSGAFRHAAPHLQQLFGSSETFMSMVRRGYQPVYRPRAVRFGEIVVLDGQLVQKVYVVGPDGAEVLALYTMERQADGSWRIAGCLLTQSDAESA